MNDATNSEDSEIYVTKPCLPPLDKFNIYLKQIWQTKILTNNGPLALELEAQLCKYLDVDYISIYSNATLALLAALKSLDLTGEVITTPFSFVATSHALLWNFLEPIFVDIESSTLNIDPLKIEQAITPRTSAILAVHCYGNPCLTDAVQAIADKHNLKVIYDAAHAFGVRCNEGNLLLAGDMSVLSFHATKVFHTFEGGAVVCKNLEDKKRLDRIKNFGILNEFSVVELGLNSKMNEMQAAIGILQLETINDNIDKRASIAKNYDLAISEFDYIKRVDFSRASFQNYSYYPIIIDDGRIAMEDLLAKLADYKIFPRRYFYPLISNMPMYRSGVSAAKENLPIANTIAPKILCLPIFPDMTVDQQEKIIKSLHKVCLQ